MSNRINLQTLKGFRDVMPVEKRQRDFVVRVMKQVFETYGFEPIETPTLEYASLLQGKYGEEAEQMMYLFEDRGKRAVGLRYDQTVPTARFLAQYANTLPNYFRRYQIQPVFRAENTQKGRYREFLQCDCDIFNSTSDVADAEIVAVFYMVYQKLGLDVSILLNSRESLVSAVEPFATDTTSSLSLIATLDKVDKVGEEGVIEELVSKGLKQDAASKLLNTLSTLPIPSSVRTIIEKAEALGVPTEKLQYKPMLARGLDYYTGIIFESVLSGQKGSSLGGGGRYDKLIGQLGGPDIPAVGFAVGFDRTVEAMREAGLLPEDVPCARVLVTVFDESLVTESAKIARMLRENNIPTELFPSTNSSLGKQLKYANTAKIPFVIILGPDEKKDNTLTVKNMISGQEKTMKSEELPSYITSV